MACAPGPGTTESSVAPAVSNTTSVVTTSAPSGTSTSTSVSTFDEGDIVGFGRAPITLDDETLVVALADEPDLRSRGLMGVEDFGDHDGILFSWGGATVSGRFFMLNTIVPLTIAFFSADGAFVDSFVMVPCPAEPCERYAAAAPYAFAVEFPADRVVEPGTRLGL